MSLTFINHKEFQQDVLQWERNLPEVDAFVGVPRSGVLPAALLALRRNVRLVPLDTLLSQPTRCIAMAALRDSNPAVKNRKPVNGSIMVVDDCCSQHASTMKNLKAKLKRCPLKVHFGAVYQAEETSELDFVHRTIPQPRLFEWNFFRHRDMRDSMWDIDGALCDDWSGAKEKFDTEAYESHLKNTKPLYIPERQIYAVCTNRLSRWIPQTRQWLQHNKVNYQQLLMSPYNDVDDRDQHDKPRGLTKGKIYAQHNDAKLFVESDIRQARVIAVASGKPVLAIDEMRLL